MTFYRTNGLPSAAHLELTDRCNAGCPLCSRTSKVTGGPSVFVKNTDLPFDVIRSCFTPEFLERSSFRYVHLCGNYGDPVIHPQIYEVAEHFATAGVGVGIATNGSLRSTSFWSKLGQMFAQQDRRCKVIFGLDGTDTVTHEMYRKFTSFSKVIENARAFIAAGGVAIWQFIVFDHNEHQVDEARRMAKELGFDQFKVQIGNRIKPKEIRKTMFLETGPTSVHAISARIVDRNQRTLEYGIKLTSRLAEATRKSKAYSELTVIEDPISCKVKIDDSVFISAEGFVFPCCWTALHYNRLRHAGDPAVEEFATLTPTTPQYSWGPELNVNHSELEIILQHEFFNEIDALVGPGAKNPLWPCFKACFLNANKEVLEQTALQR